MCGDAELVSTYGSVSIDLINVHRKCSHRCLASFWIIHSRGCSSVETRILCPGVAGNSATACDRRRCPADAGALYEKQGGVHSHTDKQASIGPSVHWPANGSEMVSCLQMQLQAVFSMPHACTLLAGQ